MPYLGELTWEEAEQALGSNLVIVPFAAGAKQHGPHLPLNTDALVMTHLLDAAVEATDVIVAPPVLHGWFPAFRSFPGTEVADAGVFAQYLSAVARSLVKHGAKRLVFLNLGVSNASGLPIAMVAKDLAADRDLHTLVVSWDDLETVETAPLYAQQGGGHADEGETSIVLYLKPQAVRRDRTRKSYRTAPAEQIGYRPRVFDRATESGAAGDPSLATPEKGSAILAIMCRNWLTALDQFDAATRGAR